jgi:energy-coupling factor transporter ATP-binding protein EcfA2
LEELEITGRETGEAEDLVDAVKRIKRVTGSQDAALDAVAKALLESGALGEDRIRKAEQAFADKYVQEQAAQLQAKAQEALALTSTELRQAQSDLKDVQGRLQKEEAERRAKHEHVLATEREASQKSIMAERAAMDNQRAELERQQHVLQKNLEHVTKELREAGDTVVNRFLTIAPLLGSMGLSSGQRSRDDQNALAHEQASPSAPAFVIPPYVGNGLPPEGPPLAEDAFFDRFRQFVEASGFVYRSLDLQRFHLSVKCGEMTVLGGPSGTGKSSLPALYARALLGDESARGRPECLMVNVNPSWMDIRDLMGHLNTLDGKYYPAESGLFQHLVCAQEEFAIKAHATGLYLACLDEMNLSQVEHYFSDFMMVLDREDAARAIQCFSPEAAKPACQFRSYARLRLSPGARFVGTVNFDETTRLLSDRFLDRVNLIRLSSGSLPNVSKSGGELHAKASGRMVTLSDYESWRADSALPEELGSLLDTMRPLLSDIGCPLSPRVYRGICRFVASATRVLQGPVAFDVQIAQRVVPKVRGLVTKRQLESLDSLIKLMNAATACAFEESVPLLEGARESAGARTWDMED